MIWLLGSFLAVIGALVVLATMWAGALDRDRDLTLSERLPVARMPRRARRKYKAMRAELRRRS